GTALVYISRDPPTRWSAETESCRTIWWRPGSVDTRSSWSAIAGCPPTTGSISLMSGIAETMWRLIVISATAVIMAPMTLGQETPPQPSCTLPQMLAARAKVQGGSATFTQERRIHYVRDPLSSAG